jgi:hypothetical protein
MNVGPNPNIIDNTLRLPNPPPIAPPQNLSSKFEGKTVYEAIALQSGIQASDLKIEKIKGKFEKDSYNADSIIASSYKMGGKEYFKFEVEWEVKVEGVKGPIKFKQDIFTNMEIPPLDSPSHESAKSEAFQVAKSYELIQKSLAKKPDSISTPTYDAQVDVLKRNNHISFQKVYENSKNPAAAPKLKAYEAKSYGTDTQLYLTAVKIKGSITSDRLELTARQKIILVGTSKKYMEINTNLEFERQKKIEKEFNQLEAQFLEVLKTFNTIKKPSIQAPIQGKGKKPVNTQREDALSKLEDIKGKMETKQKDYDETSSRESSVQNVMTKSLLQINKLLQDAAKEDLNPQPTPISKPSFKAPPTSSVPLVNTIKSSNPLEVQGDVTIILEAINLAPKPLIISPAPELLNDSDDESSTEYHSIEEPIS